MSRYSGPSHYTTAQRYAWNELRARHPHAYRIAGLGWCGPGWAEIEAGEREIERVARMSPEEEAVLLRS